ncbi:hypothetical protein [Terasakiella pusilla]|jgi:hypothetical protein|uniref:hypothetical protein n=1 Tax=Terasakiella pusilla TaxID=64973 RepID=UPI00048E6E81|nr:hypothetical protein [Terasakiella pusilla]
MRKSTLVKSLVLVTGILGFSLTTTHTSRAEETITPSQVFQVTEDILWQLDRLHDANLSFADFSNTRLDIPERLPRHVIQQALNLRGKIQVLKRINGIETKTLPVPPVREVTPADVISVVKDILADLVSLDAAYGLEPFKAGARLKEGKTPTDVYKNLLRAESMIIQLGIPEVVPNDVFNTALAVTQEIEILRKVRGKTEPVDPPSPSIGKQPADSYSMAFYALKGIKGLTKKPEYQIPGEVILPERLKKDISSRDVQQVLLYCLAELSSMKVAAGAKDPLVLPPPTAGQTPSTVFDTLGLVNRQIQSMQW